MLTRILVGLDGSNDSDAAVELALRWATPSRALVGGIAVVDEPEICAPEAVPLGGGAFKEARDAAWLEEARGRVEGLLDAFGRRCANAGVPHLALNRTGSPVEQILLEAQRFDVVLLGRQTRFCFETREGPDETLREVVKQGPRPVVAVPPKGVPGGAVVVGYDGSLQAARALFALAATGLTQLGPVHVVGAGEHREPTRRAVERAVDYLRGHGVEAEAHALTTQRPADEVLREEVDRHGAGLLVLGAYGQPVLREFFLGSVTRRLIDSSPVPLFLFH